MYDFQVRAHCAVDAEREQSGYLNAIGGFGRDAVGWLQSGKDAWRVNSI